MIRSLKGRYHVPILLALAYVSVLGKATATLQIPATAGRPGNSAYVINAPDAGPQYFTWNDDVFVRRPTESGSPFTLEWIIPLVYYETSSGMKVWWVKVFVSNLTKCRLEWRPDDVPVTPTSDMATGYKMQLSGDGELDLTTDDKCPIAVPGLGCKSGYASAYISCVVPKNGFVGPVNYTIDDAPPDP
jgi:hypothetical protein